jgi:hypothetical protein
MDQLMDLIARPMGLANKDPRRDGQRCAGIDAYIEQARAEPRGSRAPLIAESRAKREAVLAGRAARGG